MEVRLGGMVRIWSGNTFARGVSGFDLDYNGTIHWVSKLDLTVQDKQGTPISDATFYT